MFMKMVRGASRRPLHILLLLLPLHLLFAEGPADPHFQAGLAYERLGRYDEAYTELQLAFALDPNSTGAALALGLVASRLGNLEVAQRALERSIALDASSVASYYQLALLYEKKQMADRAQDAWHRFLPLSQDEALKAVAQKHLQYLESQGR
jgi:tetratricopeptide (TPR) repeat protein